jgi:ribose 5-phosphate isomerase A
VATNVAGDLNLLGDAASAYVEEGMRVGLGTGHAATAFIHALATRFQGRAARLTCVATSEATAKLAADLGLRVTSLADAGELDLTVDGADEVDPRLDLIKGLGGALVREKIVAASSRRLVIVVGAEKLVPRLGVATRLPVEVLPFGEALCRRRLAGLGAEPLRELASGLGADVPFFLAPGPHHLRREHGMADDLYQERHVGALRQVCPFLTRARVPGSCRGPLR